MGVFKMQTGEVHQLGGNVNDLASEFGENVTGIQNTVDELVGQDWTTQDAQDVGQAIHSYDELLRKIQAKLDAHGDYGRSSSQRTDELNREISSRIAKNI